MALLEVENLQTHFRTPDGVNRAVDGVSFYVEEGETLAIVGESGCGKSVTAMSILRLIPEPPGKIAGALRLEGCDLMTLDDRAMRAIRGNDISMIFQEPMTSLNPVLSIGRQLGETLRLHQGLDHKSAQARAADMLNLVGISEPGRRLREYPHQMSGGMRQRVMIAMALACNPKLLIADEPTTALDVTIQAQILDLMAAARSRRRPPPRCFAPRGIPIRRACSARCRSSVPRSPAPKPGSPRFRAPCPASSSASSAACLQAAARAPPSCAGKWRRR